MVTDRVHILIILDGWGLNPVREGNSVALAKTPNFDDYWYRYPHACLEAFGTAVGLPEGQMGGSEVGHLNMGAGRTVLQDMTYIDSLIENKSFYSNLALLKAMEHVRKKGSRLHLVGLLSHGGVHSSQTQLYALLKMAKLHRIADVFVHAFLDGRDVAPSSAKGFIIEAEKFMKRTGVGRIATLSGRFYSMDRDTRWDRTKAAFDAIVVGKGETASSALQALDRSYNAGYTDEFVKPVVIVSEDGKPVTTVEDGDCVIHFNFRSDRAKQLTRAFTEPKFDSFFRVKSPRVHFVCFKKYDDDIKADIAFLKPTISNVLAEYLSNLGLPQLHVAETEKFNHVTYFFNGERMEPFPGEDRIKVPSPPVRTYDQKPEMSAREITADLLKRLEEKTYPFIVLNYANCDLVGHSGMVDKGIMAVETVDQCMGLVVRKVLEMGGAAFLTADHGNSDQMIDPVTSEPWTAHTYNPVPFIIVDDQFQGRIREHGLLADVAPTVLQIMGLPQPEEMTGTSLITSMHRNSALLRSFIGDNNDIRYD